MDPMNLSQASTGLPLMSFNSPDFDYTAFLPEQHIEYYGEGASSASVPHETSASPPTDSAVKSVATSRRQRMERRGHTKSRRGCYNCKRRRIKCQEARPACGHCVKTGLQCEYPATPQITHQPQHQIPLFSLQDMRFFQHFLLTCFPRHPLGNECVWTHEVPCLSQNYEYLMHAILGLAASDLMSSDPSLVTFAMAHRLKAIKAIKKTLADVPKTSTFEEGNAMMATCFALTFQSVSLDDGMAEFMTFCRGIIIVAIQMFCKGSKVIFHNFIGEDQMAVLQPFIEVVPPIHRPWTDMAADALRALEPLCKHQVEVEYQRLLIEMCEALYTSPVLGLSVKPAYQILCKHYGWWMQVNHESFQQIIDPDNPVQLLLASHWIALKMMMAPITATEHKARAQPPTGDHRLKKDGSMDVGMARWLRHLNRQIEGSDHYQHNQWPLWVEAQLDADPKFFDEGRPRNEIGCENGMEETAM